LGPPEIFVYRPTPGREFLGVKEELTRYGGRKHVDRFRKNADCPGIEALESRTTDRVLFTLENEYEHV
jgi:hypothetical protein